MLISQFPAAFAVEFLVVPCAFAPTETRLPAVGRKRPALGSIGPYPACHPGRTKNGCAPARAAARRHDHPRLQPLTVRPVLVTPLARRAFFAQFLKE